MHETIALAIDQCYRACSQPPMAEQLSGLTCDLSLLAACRGADRPATQPIWCLPGCRASMHLGQWLSSLPWPRSLPDPLTSGLARQWTC